MENGDEATWAEVAGSGLLADLFGGWPSFRDAEIRSISIRKESGEVEIVVDYSDSVESEPEANIQARIGFVWTSVVELDVSLTDTWLGGIEFKKSGDLMLTLLDQRNGTSGRIVAAAVEATLELLETPSGDAEEFPTIRLLYR